MAVGEVSCVVDTVKGLTARSLHSEVLGGVNWARRTVKEGLGVDPIVAGGPREDSVERSPVITEFDSIVSV